MSGSFVDHVLLPLAPPAGGQEERSAALFVASRATGPDDLRRLLDMLGLSGVPALATPPRTGRSASYAVTTRGKARP